ncbi:MAG TPA: hypothetical protein PK028_01230 [Bacteroidales bacterium]|jgi:hypothetical protein|nr:hypothetical protein [Bacteroidales bacterium]MDI9573991.1 hypothetical protein [Bacteroidota bacterium]MBP9511478.1 hypothetical protein [Bacteroidales bacterium]MBP9589158.1 hypothetical protein [Bacteroidales bacterium]HNQ59657.1 hypothetical protein [Bacteroidales bacterium]
MSVPSDSLSWESKDKDSSPETWGNTSSPFGFLQVADKHALKRNLVTCDKHL